MIIEHAIIDDDIILILDFNFEIGSFKKQNKSFNKLITEYIENNNIEWEGKKIFLVLGGVVLATFVCLNNTINITDVNADYKYTSYFSKINDAPVIEEKIIDNSETIDTGKKNVTPEKDKTTIKKDSTKKSASSKSSTSKKYNTVTNSSTASKSSTTNSTKNTSSNSKTTTNKNVVTIYRSNGSMEKLDLEEYVIGVVAAEMPASFNIEALKSQAVLARTYALKSKQTGRKLTDTVSTQAYIDSSQMKNKWGNDYLKYYNKIKKAVETTKGMYITYNGLIIDAVYHSTSNGYTEDAVQVWGYSLPYLKSVESPWDKNTSSYKKVKEFKIEDILRIFGIAHLDEIEIISRNSSGRVISLKIGDNTYTGVDFRNLLSLRSTDFDIEKTENSLKITTRGYGHGVGMSQYGANEMAKKGSVYSTIIKYYYSGVKINKL